jgi:hypothetical protein
LSGGLDEVTIYNSALSANVIQAIYYAWDAGKCTPEVNAARDLLLVYNTSPNPITGTYQSREVMEYYLAHRPMVGGASVLPITCPLHVSTSPAGHSSITVTPSEYTDNIETPLLQWLSAHPTLRPQYIVLFLDVPSRINGYTATPPYRNDFEYPAQSSVSYRIHTMLPGYAPYVTHINMRDNACCGRSTSTMACLNYIDKLQSFGAGGLIISGGAKGGHTYYFDDTRFNYSGSTPGAAARDGVLNANPAASVVYVNNPETGYGQYNPETGYSGWVGMQIVVGANPLTVTKLGRMMAPGNSGTHTVKLVNIDGSDVPGGAVAVNMTGGTAGQFQYGSLSGSGVTLAANTTYWLLSQEPAGGDSWYDWDTQVTTTGVAVENAVVWSTAFWNTYAAANQAFGPVNFKYGPAETAYVTGVVLGTLCGANDPGTGWVGMQIVVGANPLTVTKLGRMMAPGNSGTHTVKLVQANGLNVPGGAVAINMTGGTAGEFQYGSLISPVTLAANTTYWLLSQETAGGDSWYDWDTQVTTTGAALDNAVAWGAGLGFWNTFAVANNRAFGPVDFKYSGPAETAYVTGVVLGTPRNDYGSLRSHITSGSGVAGYLCWGAHSSLGNEYAIFPAVQWSGNSAWWIIGTMESYNGQPFAGQGDFYMWFDYRAFKGPTGNYENTPVGAVTYTDEPGGTCDPYVYFGYWEAGNNFAVCAWTSRRTDKFQAVGDPFVTK